MATTTSTTSTKKQGMPFIMPDGRPLGLFLTQSNLMVPERRSTRRSKRRPRRDPNKGWTSSLKTAATNGTNTNTVTRPTELSAVEQAELLALEKVGQRRQRRWLNDKLLRDMSGNLTAGDMQDLFKPAPFGYEHVSAFTEAASAEYAPLWDLFRTVDSDRQERVLQKWQEYVDELRQDGSNDDAVYDAASEALRCWSCVNTKARKALRKAPRGCIEELEKYLVDFIDQEEEDTNKELVLDLEDGFQRLLTHGLAEYHSLKSYTRTEPNGNRVFVAKRQPEGSTGTLQFGFLCGDIISFLEEQHTLDVRVLRKALGHVVHNDDCDFETLDSGSPMVAVV